MLLLSCTMAQAQIRPQEFSLNYNYARPSGGMSRNIDRGHGFSTYYGFVLPGNRLVLGLDMSFVQYARDKSRQEYTFDDGTTANMDIIVTNAFTTVMTYARWYPGREEALLRPFLFAKAGYTWYATNLHIYDPDDFDRCEAVDSDLLYRDGTPAASGGMGLKLDLASVFRNMTAGMLYLETSINVLYGGHVKYMNANQPVSHHGTVPDTDLVMADFRNIDTHVIHKHHVGYVYRNRAEMAELRVGLSMRLSR